MSLNPRVQTPSARELHAGIGDRARDQSGVADGMVVEGRDYYDSTSIARQLGLVDG